MIEVVYNKDEETESGRALILPKNIRQVGETSHSRKIYIEDYAYNYIDEYAGGSRTVVGVLLGDSRQQKNERYLFIKGAMSVDNVEISGEGIRFTEENWNDIYAGMKKYFPESEIVGWFVIESDFGKDILKKLKKTHSDNFAGNEKTLFIVDRTEGIKYFCTYENNHLEKMSGYIIYYEKNECMQNYLIEMRQGTRVEEENQERVKGNFRKLLQEAAQESRPSKRVYISYAANAAMVVMILFIGMYMVNSHERINRLDSSVTEISSELTVINAETTAQKPTLSLVPVVEISGNVYPIEEQTPEVSVETGVATDAVTEPQTEGPSEKETITASNPVSAVTKTYETYEVKKGETLITISKKFYGSTDMIDSIMELNGIKNRDYIYEGQIIKLP